MKDSLYLTISCRSVARRASNSGLASKWWCSEATVPVSTSRYSSRFLSYFRAFSRRRMVVSQLLAEKGIEEAPGSQKFLLDQVFSRARFTRQPICIAVQPATVGVDKIVESGLLALRISVDRVVSWNIPTAVCPMGGGGTFMLLTFFIRYIDLSSPATRRFNQQTTLRARCYGHTRGRSLAWIVYSGFTPRCLNEWN